MYIVKIINNRLFFLHITRYDRYISYQKNVSHLSIIGGRLMSGRPIRIVELMGKTEQWLLSHGYTKNTLGTYKATWNRFLLYSKSPLYSRETAENFLLHQFGVNVHIIGQKLDMRMRHARRHMNSLDEFFREGSVCRRKVRGLAVIDDDKYNAFFSDYLDFCKAQNYSESWVSNTIAGLKVFLLAIHATNTQDINGISTDTINCFVDAMNHTESICMNVRRLRCRQVGAYLYWLYTHNLTDRDYSLQLPNFKRTAPRLPHIWSPEEIDKILSVIDTVSPIGKRNYAIFLLLARTGLRISDVVGLKFSNLDWRNNCIKLSQHKTGVELSLPLSRELGVAIISYLQDGRPNSSLEHIFLSHNAPFQPLNEHNNFNVELRKYLRRAGIPLRKDKHAGVHTFRHSFATNMLKKGTSLQDVSQILGHSDINVTETYLKVDIEQLRLCSLSLGVRA